MRPFTFKELEPRIRASALIILHYPILLLEHGRPELLHVELSTQLSGQPPSPLIPQHCVLAKLPGRWPLPLVWIQ